MSAMTVAALYYYLGAGTLAWISIWAIIQKTK
jgi:hypothetical protein